MVCVNEFEGVLGPSVVDFVDRHVRSLLTWDILLFFHRNPDAELDVESLGSRLGRKDDELKPEIDQLCSDGLLGVSDGSVRYCPDPELRTTVGRFADASQERSRRLALLALVLQKIGPGND
jgi:hypothetical protein